MSTFTKILAVLAVVSLSACSTPGPVPTVTPTVTETASVEPSQSPTADTAKDEEEFAAEVKTLIIPDVISQNASDALDEVRELGYTEAVLQDASSEERLVLLRSNWYVCSMKPEPGSTLDTDKVLVLLAVKNSESCPKSAPSSQVSGTTKGNTPATEPSPTQTSADITTAQKNAVRKAESYLSFMSFSKTGLVDQLEFEGFSTADSTFAVDYLEVDWNKQAAKKAASYLDLMAFSRDGLIEQLLFEGFTQSQAEYGASQNGY